MGIPVNRPNFNSGVQGAAWFTFGPVNDFPKLIVVSQWDALVRRFQKNMLAILPNTFPSTLNPNRNIDKSTISEDGLFGEEAIDALAEALRRSGYADEIPGIVSAYRRGTISSTVVLNVIYFGLFVTSIGTREAPMIMGSIPRFGFLSFNNQSIYTPILLRGHTRVRSEGSFLQRFVGTYDPSMVTPSDSSDMAGHALPLADGDTLYLPGAPRIPRDVSPPPLPGTTPTPSQTASSVSVPEPGVSPDGTPTPTATPTPTGAPATQEPIAAAPPPSAETGANSSERASAEPQLVYASPPREAPMGGELLPDVRPESDGVPISKEPQAQLFGYSGGIPDWGWGLIIVGGTVAVTGTVYLAVRSARKSKISASSKKIAAE